MATMSKMTLIKPVGDTTVSYEGEYIKDEYGTESKSSASSGDRVRRERNFVAQRKGPIDEWDDGTTGNYARIEGGNGSETQTLYGRYRYQYRIGKWYWKITQSSEFNDRTGTVSSLNEIPDDYTTTSNGNRYTYTYTWDSRTIKDGYWKDDIDEPYEDENGNIVQPEWIDTSYKVYDWEEYLQIETLTIDWDSWTPEYTKEDMSVDFYPRPKEFYFINCEPGKQWRVDLGLQTLITNIYEFQEYANQWQAWKKQEEYSNTPSFDSPLSAANINSIYSSLGHSGGYSSGNEVRASIFKGLESIIN